MVNNRFEVQTYTALDGWINCWHVDDQLQYFDTEREAQAEIYEFFADLAREGIVWSYDLDHYRVAELYTAPLNS